MKSQQPQATGRKHIWLFVFLSTILAWVVAIPAYLVPDSERPLVMGVCAAVMMFTPLIATCVVGSRHSGGWKALRSSMAIAPSRPLKSFFAYLAIALLGTVALSLAALLVATWCGLLTPDLASLSGYRAIVSEQITSQVGNTPEAQQALDAVKSLPSWVILATLAGQIVIGSFINMIFAFGEEAGWRGWLHTHLRQDYSFTTTALVTGVIWGLWHTPLILLGHNYPTLPGAASVAMMVVFCVLVGVLFSWLREVSGSVWPATLAHGALNASASLPLALAAAGGETSTVSVTLLGWTGWIVLALVATAALIHLHIRGPQTADRS